MTEQPINLYQTSFLSQANKHRPLKSSKKPLNNEMNAWKFPLQKYAGNWRQLIFTDASMNLSNLSGFAWTNLLDRADARGQNYIEGEEASGVKLTPRIGNISDQPLWSIPHDTTMDRGKFYYAIGETVINEVAVEERLRRKFFVRMEVAPFLHRRLIWNDR